MKEVAPIPRRSPRAFRWKTPSFGAMLNMAILVLTVLVAYLGYSLLVRVFFSPSVDVIRDGDPRLAVIQVDVLNGCGAPGAGTSFTAYLRSRGYDVVEIRNYHRYDVRQTLVVERAGNLKNAEKVARALGISSGNIVQQLNPEYYVDVSVVIGKDFQSLKPSL